MSNGKRILISGGFGFLGNNLYRYLRQNMPNDIEVLLRFRSATYDLTNAEQAKIAVRVAKPDVVIHLAALCGGIGANMMNPATFWRHNTLMGVNILDACAEYKVPHLITMGTVCSYGQHAKTPFHEDQLFTEWPEITNRPYGVAKINILEGARAYQEQFGLKSTYLIPTNLFGPFDNFDLDSSHVIPAMIRKMHEAVIWNKPYIDLWGDGTPTRDFLYVDDLCRAIMMCISNPITGPYNLGSGHEISMAGLAEAIAAVVGYKGDLVWNLSMPNGQMRRLVGFDKIKKDLGWEPKTHLVDGIGQTYRWFLRKDMDSPET